MTTATPSSTSPSSISVTTTSPSLTRIGTEALSSEVDLTTAAAPCPEAIARVTATAADLVSQGRRVTERELSRLTGLEPPTVVGCLDDLVRRGVLQPVGAAPHHFVFAPGHWPFA